MTNKIKQIIPVILLFLLLMSGLSSQATAKTSNHHGGVSSKSQKHSLTRNSCARGDRHSYKQHSKWTKRLIKAKGIPAKAKRRHRHYVRCPKGPNHRKRMQLRWKRIKRSIAKPLPANYSTWIRIGRCEQPGSGRGGINWSHPGPTYGGGLGMWYGNWTSLKPRGYPATSGQATWRQQMKVANILAARYGFSAWSCY